MYFRNPVLKSKQVCGDKWLSDLWISSESAFIYFSFLFLKHLLETNRESIACSIPFKFHSRLSAFLERTKSTSHIDLFSKCFSGLSTRKNTSVFGKVCFATEPFPLWHNKEGEVRAPIRFVLQLTSAATRATVGTCHACTLRFFGRIRILETENEFCASSHQSIKGFELFYFVISVD